MEFVLRRATETDLEAVGTITVEAYCGDGFIAPEDDYVKELADAADRFRNAEIWVADGPDGVVGSVTYCWAGMRHAEVAHDGEGEFRMLGVSRSARRQGVAEALVRRCIERSEELGHSAIVMCSMPVMVTAHRLYERLGFRRLPERDWSPAEGIELLAFRRPLP